MSLTTTERWLIGATAAIFISLQTAIVGVGINLLERVARIEERILLATDDRFRKRDADAAFALRDQRIDDLNGRVRRIEENTK